MTKIKLCGIKRPQDIEVINEIKPDYAGFVFWQKSKRYVTDDEAVELKGKLFPDTKAVGVFLDEDVKHIIKLAREDVIDVIQLHGHEDEDYIKKLRQNTTIPIIKAFVVKEAEVMEAVEKCSADMVLLDAGTGSGEIFDWDILKEVKRDYILAGGLDPENVAEAVKRFSPYGVDVSSGIETNGLKDPDKMRRFAREVRYVG